MFLAIRDLRFAWGRFALMGVVITLITLMVVLLSGLTAGLANANTSAILGLKADHLAFAAPADGAGISFADSFIDRATQERLAALPGVQRADPLAIGMSRAETDDRSAAVAVFAVAPGSALAPAPVQAGQAVLSEELADALGASVGQRMRVDGSDLTVTAITGRDAYSHVPVMWTTFSDHVRAGAPDGSATVVALTTSGADLAAAGADLGTRIVTPGEALSAIGSFQAENGSLQLMRMMLFAISALVVGAFFMVWTVQRSGEVAVLKAVGASTGYLLRDALAQALVLLLLGTSIGTAIAVGLGALAGAAAPFVLDAPTVLVPALVMIALGLLGAAISLRSITSVDPLTALGSAR